MRFREVLSASLGLSFLICQIGEWVRWWMLRSLQFHEYEMIIAIVFLHYLLTFRTASSHLECGSFTLAVTWHKVTKSLACLPAPQTDMCAPGLGRAEGQGREMPPVPTLIRRKLLRGGPRLRPRVGLCIHLAFKSLRMLGSHHHAAVWQV